MAALKIDFVEVQYTTLNGTDVENYSDTDLLNFIGAGYEEVKRINELAACAKSTALRMEADNMTTNVIRIGKILDARALDRLAKSKAKEVVAKRKS